MTIPLNVFWSVVTLSPTWKFSRCVSSSNPVRRAVSSTSGTPAIKWATREASCFFPHGHDISEEGVAETTAQFSESISVEEKKWSLAMEPLQALNGLKKGQ
ncbi:MAG: hypothetical protein LV480_13620 [Methylacidiphilales bacterium]|nr:hypothetical protein [Candidatus Methylacidiphilales bacterium]